MYISIMQQHFRGVPFLCFSLVYIKLEKYLYSSSLSSSLSRVSAYYCTVKSVVWLSQFLFNAYNSASVLPMFAICTLKASSSKRAFLSDSYCLSSLVDSELASLPQAITTAETYLCLTLFHSYLAKLLMNVTTDLIIIYLILFNIIQTKPFDFIIYFFICFIFLLMNWFICLDYFN